MNLEELKRRGAFVSAAPVPKEVSWTHVVDGEEVTDTFTIHVRRRSYGSVERVLAASMSDDGRSMSAAFIAESLLLGDDGSERISYEDAYQLDPSLAAVLVDAINEVNGLGRAEPKNSQPPMNSGTSSS